MPGMGPPPKPAGQRARRNASVAMTQLPAEGRKKPAPAWPLPADVRLTALVKSLRDEVKRADAAVADAETRRELAAAKTRSTKAHRALDVAQVTLRESGKHERAIWAELWALPQAVAWERMGWTREVAQYARFKAAAELGDLDSAKEARQHADRLGLSPLSMLRLRWEVVEPEVGAQLAPAAATGTTGGGSRDRFAGLQVLDGGGGTAGPQ